MLKIPCHKDLTFLLYKSFNFKEEVDAHHREERLENPSKGHHLILRTLSSMGKWSKECHAFCICALRHDCLFKRHHQHHYHRKLRLSSSVTKRAVRTRRNAWKWSKKPIFPEKAILKLWLLRNACADILLLWYIAKTFNFLYWKLSFKQIIHSYKRCVGCVSFSNNLAFR